MSDGKFKFQQCSQTTVEKTPIWEHFLRESSGEHAKCKICQKILKTSGKSTSGLHKHLSSMHSDIKSKKPASETSEPPAKRRNLENPTGERSITNYFAFQDNSLEAIVARMTSVDGLPFSIFVTSTELRKLFLARGFDLPKSSKTIREMVMKFGYSIREKFKIEMQKLIAAGKSFSLTFDEWTANKNRRYLNVNSHIKNRFWNLGLVRVHGSLPAESCIKLLEERLELYGINLHEDVVCITTDGASVMQKGGRLPPCFQQLCLAHAVHLAICDILYKKPKPVQMEKAEDAESADSDLDDDTEEEGFQVSAEIEVVLEFEDDLHPFIQKIRTVMKLFRKSPTKNDILQKHIKEQFGKELQLILDVKTRWNSLFSMLQRFYHVKNCILKSLIDVEPTFSFGEDDFTMISNLLEVLEPVKLACESFCRRDATLSTADATISFMINNLGSSDLAQRLKESLTRRINERRTNVSGLLQFLHKGNQSYADLHLDPLLNFGHMSKTTITTMISKMLKPSENDLSSESEPDVEVADEDESQLSLQEKLSRAISAEVNAKITPKKQTMKDITNVVKKELLNFEIEGKRGTNLERCHENLSSIPPASVESERIFSGCSHIVTEIRPCLSDESLDILSFLRSYFQSKNSN